MSATGYIRGHAAFYDGEIWRWQDTTEPAGPVWGGEERPCPKCDEMPTPEGYDACIGHIPGASSVCCGHGVGPPVLVREIDEEKNAAIAEAERIRIEELGEQP